MGLLKNMSLVVISPAAGWDDIDKSGYPASTVLSGLYYPLLALMSVSCFCAMLYDHTLTLSMSVMRAVIAFVSYFIAYYTVVFLIDCLFPRQTQGKVAKARCCNYVAYILSFLVILETLLNVLQQYPPMNFFRIYAYVIAFRGLDFVKVDKAARTKFLLVCGTLLIAVPILLSRILGAVIVVNN